VRSPLDDFSALGSTAFDVKHEVAVSRNNETIRIESEALIRAAVGVPNDEACSLRGRTAFDIEGQTAVLRDNSEVISHGERYEEKLKDNSLAAVSQTK
jgi:hypothetical protein